MKCFLKKALRWLAILSATVATLLLVFYAEEDWRGARDWAAYQRDLAAKGETLDLRQLVPPGNPADDLSKVPIFAELYQEYAEQQKNGKSTIHPRIRQIKTHLKPSNDGNILPKPTHYTKGEALDLLAWQKYYRSTTEAHLSDYVGTPAQDILKAFDQFDSDLRGIDLAVSNPNAYWPTYVPSSPDTPAYTGACVALAPVAQVLQFKAVAHLENHEAEMAENEYLFCFRLTRPLAHGDYLSWLMTSAIP